MGRFIHHKGWKTGPQNHWYRYDILLIIIICISLIVECYMEYYLTALIGLSMFGFYFGLVNNHTPHWTITNIKYNLWSLYLPKENFFTMFAVFFPGCTDIMTGAYISGDLVISMSSRIFLLTFGGLLMMVDFLFLLDTFCLHTRHGRSATSDSSPLFLKIKKSHLLRIKAEIIVVKVMENDGTIRDP